MLTAMREAIGCVTDRLSTKQLEFVYAALSAVWVAAAVACVVIVWSDQWLMNNIDWARRLGLLAVEAGLVAQLFHQLHTRRLERDRAEREQVDRMLQHFFDQPFIGMMITSPATGAHLRFNDCICGMLGYTRSEFAKLSYLDVVHPEDLQRRANIISRVLRGDCDSGSAVARYRHKDGSVVHAHINWSCIESSCGETVYLVVTVLDLTDLRKAESKAAFQSELLVQMAHIARIGGWSADLRTGITYCSDEVFRLHELEPGETLDMGTGISYYAPEAQPIIETAVAAAISDGTPYDLELPFVTAKGKALWVRTQGTAVREGGETVMLCGAFQDITERKQNELRARQLFQAVEQTPVSVVITDRFGIIEYVNPAFCQCTGFALEEAIGSNPRILKSGENPAALYEDLWKTLKAGRSWKGNFCNCKKNGEIFWESATISPLVDDLGRVTHFVAVKEDITERKQIVETLERYKLHLEDIVAERTAELSDALEAALLADRVKDEFLANVSHELRTPLNVVIGLADLAYRATEEPKLRDYLDKITGAGKSLAVIINDLLDLSKIAAGHLEFDRVPFSLRQLVRRNRLAISHRAEEKGLALGETIDDAIPEVLMGDPVRVEQILNNLLGNAVKFTSRGSVDLVVRLRSREGQRVCLELEVADTGIGISEDKLRQLFRPFAQGDASVSRRYGGTGLGLAISKRLAEMMNGNIEVASREGNGSRFTVTFWLDVAETSQLTEITGHACRKSLPKVMYRDVCVLVADDHPLNQEIAGELLAAVGIKAEFASNGREVLDMLSGTRPNHFDLVLMDIQMPIMDGLTATRRLRLNPLFANLPIVALTAQVMDHEKKKSLAAGINGHIGKPFDVDEFYSQLAEWIPSSKQCQQAPSQDATETAESNKFPAIPGIDTDIALLRFGGNRDRYRHWLLAFETESPLWVDSVRRKLEQGDRDEACRLLHSFKGRVGLLGMAALHKLVIAAESRLHAGEAADADLASMQEAVDALVASIQAVFSAHGPQATAEPESVRKGTKSTPIVQSQGGNA